MLRVFRQGGAMQAVIGAVVALIIVVFVVEFRAGSGQGSGKIAVECAVKVGTRCVNEKEFVAAQRLAAWDGIEPKQAREIDFNRRIAEGLVERELLIAEATRLGLGISDTEIEDELEAGRVRVSLPARDLDELAQRLGLCNWVPNPLVSDPDRARKLAVCDPDGPRGVRTIEVRSGKTGRFDYKIYERTIRVRANRSPKEFRATQRDELLAERMREAVRNSVRVSEAETWLAYERENTTAIIDRVSITSDWFARYAVEAPDALVDDWAVANQAEMDQAWSAAKDSFVADCPMVSELVVRFGPTTTDEDKVVLRSRIDEAKLAIEKGASFAQTTRWTGDGPLAASGGEIGCLDATRQGESGEALVQAVGELAVGQVSPVIETSQGFHLLRLNARPVAAELEAMGKRILARRRYVQFKADGLARQFAEELIGQVKAGAPLTQAAESLTRATLLRGRNLDPDRPDASALPGIEAEARPRIERSEAFTLLGRPVPDAVGSENAAALAFALERPGTAHPTPLTTRGGVAVIVLVEKKAAERAAFDRDRIALMRERQRVKADEALTRYVANLRKAAEARIQISARMVAGREDERDGEDPEE